MAWGKRNSDWRPSNDPNHDQGYGVTIEVADALEIHTGRTWPNFVYRVLVNGRPVTGKGGTHPFIGEMAWADAQRLAYDAVNTIRYGR